MVIARILQPQHVRVLEQIINIFVIRLDPGNLMQIVGVMLFDGTIDFAHLRASVEDGWLKHRRFRQLAVPDNVAESPAQRSTAFSS